MTDNQQPKVDLKVYLARQNTAFLTDSSWPDPQALERPVNYVLRRDGLWEMRKSRAGVFVRLLQKFESPLPGFPEETNVEYGRPHYGKIPVDLFREILAFFKSICDESKDEAYVQTFWDPEAQRYFNHVPKQRVSGASVHFDRDVDLEARCALVLETHSHNTMGAFFSGTDNNDEKSDRFFGVVGKLNQHSPEMLFSFVCGGKRVVVNRSDIFDEEPEVPFPGDWKSRITKYAAVTVRPNSVSEGSGMAERRMAIDSTDDEFFGGYGAYYGRTSRHMDVEAEIDSAIGAARKSMGGGDADRPFFQRSAPSDVDDEALVDLVRSATARLANGGAEMTRVQKQKLFNKLVDAMSTDDVVDLVGALMEAGHEETIFSVLPTEEVEDVTTESVDPFLSE